MCVVRICRGEFKKALQKGGDIDEDFYNSKIDKSTKFITFKRQIQQDNRQAECSEQEQGYSQVNP